VPLLQFPFIVFPDGTERGLKKKLVRAFWVNDIFDAIYIFSGSLEKMIKGEFPLDL